VSPSRSGADDDKGESRRTTKEIPIEDVSNLMYIKSVVYTYLGYIRHIKYTMSSISGLSDLARSRLALLLRKTKGTMRLARGEDS